jgi:osmotically-inducible protein OsmY
MRHNLLVLVIAATVLAGCSTAKPVVSPYERRSNEAVYGDAEIERNYRTEMGRRVELSGPTHINLTSFNGVALLTGEAPKKQLRDRAVGLARIIGGVKEVHDYIRIAKPSSNALQQQDERLKQRLQSALRQMQPIQGFHPSQIKIVVEQGSVYLMGLVRRNEADAVIARLRSIDGVKEIVTVFTYIG